MVDRGMPVIPDSGEFPIGLELVGHHVGPLLYIFKDGIEKIVGLSRVSNLRLDVADTVCHADDGYLAASPEPVSFPAANEGLVDLHIAKQLCIVDDHEIPDEVPHPPGGLVGDTDMALELLGGHPVPGLGEQVDGEEPGCKGGRGLLKYGARQRMDLMTGFIHERLSSFDPVILLPDLWISHRKKILKAVVIIGEILKEGFKRIFHKA